MKCVQLQYSPKIVSSVEALSYKNRALVADYRANILKLSANYSVVIVKVLSNHHLDFLDFIITLAG